MIECCKPDSMVLSSKTKLMQVACLFMGASNRKTYGIIKGSVNKPSLNTKIRRSKESSKINNNNQKKKTVIKRSLWCSTHSWTSWTGVGVCTRNDVFVCANHLNTGFYSLIANLENLLVETSCSIYFIVICVVNNSSINMPTTKKGNEKEKTSEKNEWEVFDVAAKNKVPRL